MITGISIENFKGIRDRVDIELRPLTLLFGANSAGKSSILHALHFAHELFQRSNADAERTQIGGDTVDLGGFSNFVFNKKTETPVRIGFKISLDDPDAFFYSLEMANVAEYLSFDTWSDGLLDCFGFYSNAEIIAEVRWHAIDRRPYVSSFSVIVEGELFAEITANASGKQQTLRLNAAHKHLSTAEAWISDEARKDGTTPFPGVTLLEACLTDFGKIVSMAERPEGIESSWYSFYLHGLPSAIPTGLSVLPFDQHALEQSEIEEFRKSNEFFAAGGSPSSFASQVAAAISQWIAHPLSEIEAFLNGFRYLGPIREVPPRGFSPSRHHDLSRWASGLAAWDLLYSADEKLLASVSSWLGDDNRLNSGYRLKLKKYKELDLADELAAKLSTGRAFDEAEAGSKIDLSSMPTHTRLLVVPITGSVELLPSDVGVGISQVIPVIVAALDGKRRFIAIEQPELHVHPRLQAEIADLFLEACQKQGHRFLIETHSEHCILRLQRRIRETSAGKPTEGRSIMSEDLVVYHVSSDGNGTQIRRIDVDKHGEFVQPWPDDFFEIDFYERFGHDR